MIGAKAKAWFPGVFGKFQPGQETDTGKEKEDLMMMDQTYADLQRTEDELGQYKIALGERDELLRQAYREIRALRVELAGWTAGVAKRQTLLADAYTEIAEKDKAIRGLKKRVNAVGQKTTDVGSPSEPPVRPAGSETVATDQEPGHEGGPTGLPPLPQRLPDEEATGDVEGSLSTPA